MSVTGTITGVVVSKSGATLIARIIGQNGIPITQASLSTITYTVRDLNLGTTTAPAALVIATVVFDTLQLDPRWTRDGTANPGPDGKAGYNFLAALPAALFGSSTFDVDTTTFDVSRHKLQIDCKFTPVSGEAFVVPFVVTVTATYN